MTPTPPLPDADVAATKRYREAATDPVASRDVLQIGLLHAADEIDRLAKRVQEAERERDELRAWKTATHEQWAAWTRDDFKARAEAAERERDEARLPSVEEVQDVFEKARLREALAAAEAREAALREALTEIVGLMPPQRTNGAAYSDAREIAEEALAPDPASARQSDSGGDR